MSKYISSKMSGKGEEAGLMQEVRNRKIVGLSKSTDFLTHIPTSNLHLNPTPFFQLQSLMILVISLILVFSNLALCAESAGDAGYMFQYGAGARSMGMGGAFVAVADDASATYWNPAGITQVERPEFTSLASNLYEGAMYSFVGFVYPTLGSDTYGICGNMLSMGEIDGRDESNISTGSFGYSEIAVTGNYAKKLYHNLSVGASLKYFGRNMEDASDAMASIDLGVLYKPLRELSVGAVLNNGGSFKVSGETEDSLPLNLRVGAAYRMKLLNENLLLAVDMDRLTGGDMEFHGGAELSLFNDMLALRAGVDNSEYSGGVGLKYDNMNLDYAVGVHSELGTVHRVSFSYAFGPALGNVRKAKSDKFMKDGKKKLSEGKYIDARVDIGEANYLNGGEFEVKQANERMKIVTSIMDKNVSKSELEKNKEAQIMLEAANDYVNDDLNKAKERLEYVLDINKDHAQAKKLLRSVKDAMGIKALSDDDNKQGYIKQRLTKALNLFYQGLYDEAIDECNAIITIDPSLSVAYKRMGSCYYMQGKMTDAIKSWKKAVELDPTDKELMQLLNQMSKMGYEVQAKK